jgi:hypothetical protein
MKNIFVLPTEKPSRLFELVGDLYLDSEMGLDGKRNRHIYIISNEEIREGDYFIDDNNSLKRSYKLSHVQFANPKKIILTTDQDLIKDDVQAIDDKFLEWFVKNPSCKYVKVIQTNEVTQLVHNAKPYYKIVISKEEQRQHIISIMKEDEELGLYEESKQETLEEANWKVLSTKDDTFYNGAKWQAERMFEIMDAYVNDVMGGCNLRAKDWFSQFKKK